MRLARLRRVVAPMQDVVARLVRSDSIVETQLNEQSAQLNEITKKLAAWAAIIAVPTAVTGFYGQNVPYPGFDDHGGFIASCLVIIVLAGGVWCVLRRNDWL